MINVGKKLVAYNIQGFLAGQAIFFLLNFNLAERQIWIARHGIAMKNSVNRVR
jgi:6-phosphofructo-2-kinase